MIDYADEFENKEIKIDSDKISASSKNKKEFQGISMYKGFQLNVLAIQKKSGKDVIQIYHDKAATKGRKKTRVMVKCLTCEEFEEDAIRMSRNATVYAAHGMRCDGEERLKLVIDHLIGSAHDAAVQRKELEAKWCKGSSSHPWIKTIQQVNSRNL